MLQGDIFNGVHWHLLVILVYSKPQYFHMQLFLTVKVPLLNGGILENFTILHLITGSSIGLPFLISVWYIPESPIFLLKQGHVDKAQKVSERLGLDTDVMFEQASLISPESNHFRYKKYKFPENKTNKTIYSIAQCGANFGIPPFYDHYPPE